MLKLFITAYTILMRSNFFRKKKRAKAIKIFDCVMAVISIAFWGMTACLLISNFIQKKYLYPLEYKEIIVECANEFELEPAIVFSFIKVESGFKKDAVSSVGAVGLMQILPSTADYISKLIGEEEYQLLDEKTNIRYGCFYMRYLINRFEALNTAICAYNAGEGNVEAWLKNQEYSSDGKNLKKIPYKETEEYLTKIHKSCKKYKDLYGNILDKKQNIE